MYSRSSTLALLVMVLLAAPVGGANAQATSTGGAVVEVEVVPLKNGKIPQDVECVERVKVTGRARIQTFTGQRRNLENEEVCITPSGDLRVTVARGETPGFGGGGVTPPCVSASSTGCRF